MVIQPARFIVSQDENRILPRGTVHEPIDQALDVSSPYLDVIARAWMFVQSGVVSALDHGNLGQSSGQRVFQEIRPRHNIGGGLICVRGELREVSRTCSTWRGGALRYINLPSHIGLLQRVKDGRSSQRTHVVGVRPRWVHIALRGCSQKIHAVDLGPVHRGGEPSIRGGEVRGHEIVVIQVAAVVVAHRAGASNVREAVIDCVLRGVVDIPIESGGGGSGIGTVPVNVAFVPRRTEVLNALRCQVVGWHRCGSVKARI